MDMDEAAFVEDLGFGFQLEARGTLDDRDALRFRGLGRRALGLRGLGLRV